MGTHTHKPGMAYYTVGDGKDGTGDFGTAMSLFAAWDDITNQGRRVYVTGIDPKCPAAGKVLIPGQTTFVKPDLERVEKAGRKLMRKRYEAKEALAEAREAGLEALAFRMTEVDVANTLGVDRMTVRKWAGKRPQRMPRDSETHDF